MKKRKLKNRITASLLVLLFLSGCYEFDFVNQPYQSDPNSSFDVQISVIKGSQGGQVANAAYFGIMLPNGWTIADSILCTNITTNDTGFIVHSDSLSQQMSLIDLPQENYYWWVGMISQMWGQLGATFISDLKIFTDSQTGSFFIDYMLGDPGLSWGESGLNQKRSNDHLIIVGEPVGCIPEGIVLNTQEEIDNFTANYPIAQKQQVMLQLAVMISQIWMD